MDLRNIVWIILDKKWRLTELLVQGRQDICRPVPWKLHFKIEYSTHSKVNAGKAQSGRTLQCYRKYNPEASNIIWVPTARRDKKNVHLK